MNILKQAKALHEIGLAIHWLNRKSKIPVGDGWNEGPRKSWQELKRTYREGFNLGVRLGKVNELNGYSLGVIDCDVKSNEPEHLKSMEKKLKELGVDEAVEVESGRGNGSKHIYFKFKGTITPYRVAQSADKVKVFMPSVTPTKKEREVLTEKEIKKGIRLRYAWEISVMGERQQVVLPPSIHPDSGEPYVWGSRLTEAKQIPKWEPRPSTAGERDREALIDFKPVEVDLVSSKLSDRVVDQIVNGEGVDDRSAALFGAAGAMLKARFSDNEILSVLTDRSYYLGESGYDHAKTNSRRRAAEWVYKYTLVKAKHENRAAKDFEDAAEISFDESDFENDDDEVGGWKKQLERNQQDGKPKASFQNILLIMRNVTEGRVFVSRNDFTAEDVWTDETPWLSTVGTTVSDRDLIRIKDYLSKGFRLETTTEKILECLVLLADKNPFHPVKEYIEGLEWDGKERLADWLFTYMKAEGPKEYVQAVGAKTLVAMVKRIYEPGSKFDHVLILEGKQGAGKSTAARILAEPWFSDAHINISDKDAVMNMQGVWAFELGELQAMSRQEVNAVKEFVTRQIDKIRPPYGRLPIKFPRQCVFIGTTNNREYLRDKTGNRRFWPVKVGKLNRKKLARDRDQLIAEAVEWWRLGEPIYLDEPRIEKMAMAEQNLRLEHDELEDIVKEFLEDKNQPFKKRFRISDLLQDGPPVFQGLRNDRATQMRIGQILHSLGYTNQPYWDKKTQKVVRFWRL
jgi:predicted P-loop ATPase